MSDSADSKQGSQPERASNSHDVRASVASRDTIPPELAASIPSIESAAVQIGESFGRYRIEDRIGQGAMGTVYVAEDTQLQRRVALKVPKFQSGDEQDLLERFYRETRSAATLRHANICPVFDVGEIDGTHYISMAFIEGRPLSDLVGTSALSDERQVALIVRKLALALPTEAEWEYACRADSQSRFSFGDDEAKLGASAWFRTNATEVGQSSAHLVGQKHPNLWGLYDMHGNVFEWCSDGYDMSYYSRSPINDPTGSASSSLRVFRGGSCINAARCQLSLSDLRNRTLT